MVDTQAQGVAPAICLINPKTEINVGMVVRLASCYGISQVWWTGHRVNLDRSGKRRLPREERLRGYQDVTMIQHDRPFDHFPGAVPVAVEVRENAENLLAFEHPENALYVFGPEDGGLRAVDVRHCHRFLIIPTDHCLNLATAVATVLWDRTVKAHLNGDVSRVGRSPATCENRGFVDSPIVEEVP